MEVNQEGRMAMAKKVVGCNIQLTQFKKKNQLHVPSTDAKCPSIVPKSS